MEDSAADYLRLMQNPRYAKVAAAQTPEEAIAHQSRSGYATSPQYGSSLRAIHSANMAEGGIARLNSGGVPRFQSAGFVSDEDADEAEFQKYMRSRYRNPNDTSIEGIKERMQVMDDRRRAEQNNYSGLPSPFGTLSGAEKNQYIAGLTQPKQDTSSPAGRFVSGLFAETPQQKQLRLEKQNALSDRNRVMQNVKSNPFETQSKEEYEITQRAIEQANANVAQANRGGGYAPPDLYSYTPIAASASTAAPATTAAISQRPTLVADDLYGGTAPSKDFSFNEPKTGAGVDTIKDTGSGDGSSRSSDSGSRGGERQKSEYDLIREDIMSQREELKRQKQEDKYMAILQAGLGMMAGTSPNALANIGQGASAGIAQYGASGKQRAAENAALNKGLITAQRYKGMDDYQRAALASREGYQDRMLGEKGEANAERKEIKQAELDARIDKNLADAITNNAAKIDLALQKKYGEVSLMGTKERAAFEAERADRYNKEVNHYIQIQNQRLQQRYPDIFKDTNSVRPAPTGGNIIRYDAKGNVIK
jgi:hypothetical protein